ncbi:Adenylate cyclase (EC / Guanylate cyclase (EC [Olavius sp. associated proteobacterium Delta 1]|nr:Adenylate cyclase (EC / Guanylate cyclase (EC [Olavius sp. associated proteobacterium Delta 1]
MRIGLNSGPVIVDSIGDDLGMDYTAVGDTTNLASRIETMARPGTSLVSGNTYKPPGIFSNLSPWEKLR